MHDDSTPAVSSFEQIRLETSEGGAYWSARDLAAVLGYTNWRNFALAVERAQLACAQSGQVVPDHFDASIKMVILGSGAQRKVADWHLSRYACYLVVQNADPNKEIVALGQTYFAVQTQRAEQMDALAGLSERQRRLYLRAQLTTHNQYGGLRSRDIAARKGLAPNQRILDHMGNEELAANLFRATQTEAKIRREGIQGIDAANQAYLVILSPDVAEMFPDSESVNEASRAPIKIARQTAKRLST